MPLLTVSELASHPPTLLAVLFNRYRVLLVLRAKEYLERLPTAHAIDHDQVLDATLTLAALSLRDSASDPSLLFSQWLMDIHQNRLDAFSNASASQHQEIERHDGISKPPAAEPEAFTWATEIKELEHPGKEVEHPGGYVITFDQSMKLRLTKALDVIPKHQREAVRLRHVEGLRLDEIAKQLQISPSAAAGRIKRGMRTLYARVPEVLEARVDYFRKPRYDPPVPASQTSQKDHVTAQRPLDELTLPRVPTRPDRVPAFFNTVDAKLFSSRKALAKYLQRCVRSLGTVEPHSLAQAQEIARRANQLVRTYGMRFRFPGTDCPGSLTFVLLKPTSPGIFRITAEVDGVNRTASIHRDFTNLEVFAPDPSPLRKAPPRERPRGRKKRAKSN